MDRQIVYPGALPRSVDFATAQQNTMIALGWLGQSIFGTAPVAAGLAITPTTPASLSVVVGPGMLSAMSVIESTPFGSSLVADTGDALLKFGINPTQTTLTFTPPAAGMVQAWTVYASFSEIDTTNLLLPFYNSAQTGQQFSGPANTNALLPTQRRQVITINDAAGSPVASGNTPVGGVLLTGQVPLYTVTLASTVTSITAANIAVAAGNPFLTNTLQQTSAGRRLNVQRFAAAGTFTYTPTPGTNRIFARVQAGGGAGGGAPGTTASQVSAGAGGGAGGYCEKAMTSGFAGIVLTIGAGGVPTNNGSGGNGGSSSLGSVASALGGSGGTAGGLSATGGTAGGFPSGYGSGGFGVGGDVNAKGDDGDYAFYSSGAAVSGRGGRSRYGAGGACNSGAGTGAAASSFGAGGGGASNATNYNAYDTGGAGGVGIIEIEEYA